MSEQRTVISSTGEMTQAEAVEKDSEEHKKLRAQRKATLIRVLERGQVADRLQVDLPPELYGEWVPNDKMSIYEKELLGFKVDTEYAPKRRLHDQGDNSSVIGDAIFMTCTKEDHEIHEEIRRENYEALNAKPGSFTAPQREEKEFSADQRTIGMPVVQESRNRVARKAEIETALARIAAARVQAPPPSGTPIK